MYVLINREREKRGLESLASHEGLEESATIKAIDMVGRGYFSHVDPDGKEPTYLVTVPNTLFKECLHRGYSRAWLVVNGWLKSPAHRGALLSPDVTDMGIGFAHGKWEHRENVVYVVLHQVRV